MASPPSADRCLAPGLPASWDYVHFMRREGTPVLGIPFMWVYLPSCCCWRLVAARRAGRSRGVARRGPGRRGAWVTASLAVLLASWCWACCCAAIGFSMLGPASPTWWQGQDIAWSPSKSATVSTRYVLLAEKGCRSCTSAQRGAVNSPATTAGCMATMNAASCWHRPLATRPPRRSDCVPAWNGGPYNLQTMVGNYVSLMSRGPDFDGKHYDCRSSAGRIHRLETAGYASWIRSTLSL